MKDRLGWMIIGCLFMILGAIRDMVLFDFLGIGILALSLGECFVVFLQKPKLTPKGDGG